MPAYELFEAAPDAVLVTQRKLLLGDQLMMEEVGFEQSAGVLDCRLLLDHALLEPCLRGALAPTHLGAARFERRQQAAGAKHDDVRHAFRMLERDADGRTARRRMADQGRAREAEHIHEAQDEGVTGGAAEIRSRVAL